MAAEGRPSVGVTPTVRLWARRAHLLDGPAGFGGNVCSDPGLTARREGPVMNARTPKVDVLGSVWVSLWA